jgi:hypothetical protein
LDEVIDGKRTGKRLTIDGATTWTPW